MSFKLVIYNNDCLNLTKSLLIKSDLLARDVEYSLSGNTNYLGIPRTQWKYYLNASGAYHSTNTKMYVTSLDTLTTIEFTKDVLLDHPITAEKYTINTELTNDLITLYPDNLLLIMGIIYDVDINAIIDANEYTIVAYDKSLVNVQEINLLTELQAKLYHEYETYINKDYADIEPYYGAVMMSHIAKQALFQIKLIRLKNYKTTHACDYYVWTYINSKLYLEDLKTSLTTDDIFYLYKNIGRLVSYSGSNEVLYELVERFLTTDTITTYRLNLATDTNEIDELESKTSTKYIEEALIRSVENREAIIENYIEEADNSSVSIINDYLELLDTRMEVSPDNNKTRELKIFETIKNNSETRLLLTDIDLHIDGAIDGFYSKLHTITNHLTGISNTLTTLEAIIFYTYVIRKQFDNEVEYIPKHYSYIVPKKVRPTAKYLADNYGITLEGATKILEAITPYPSYELSRMEMDEYITSVKNTYHDVVRLVRAETSRVNQAKLSTIYNELYFNGEVRLTEDNIRYEDWLLIRGMDFRDFQELDWDIIENYLLINVFNLNLSVRTSQYARNITELLSRLNNYRVSIRVAASSDNLLDYHTSPIYSSVTHTDTELDIVYSTPINGISNNPASVIEVKYNTISPLPNSNLSSNENATINYDIKPVTVNSKVITSMLSQYKTNLELRETYNEQ